MVATAVAAPSLPPKQLTSLFFVMVTRVLTLELTIAVAIALQLLESVT